MKRSLALQPLSREHHTALSLAKACARAASSCDEELINKTCRRIIQAFSTELEPHFLIEEQSLLILMHDAEPLRQRTLADHQQLRELLNGLQQNNAEALGCFGELLYAHVRFEERELFPMLEKLLP